MPYKISTCKPAHVICQCGEIIKHCDMPKHILTAEHTYVYMYARMYVCMYM